MLTLSATRFVAALFATTALASFGHIAGEEFAPNSDLQVRHIASENGTSAHLFNSIPECGLSCILKAVLASPCKVGDLNCTCHNATISAQVMGCVLAGCTVKEALVTKNTTATLCKAPVRDRTALQASTGVGGEVVVLLAYLTRIASKIHIVTNGGLGIATDLGWDDVVITLATAITVVYSVNATYLAVYGFGKDVWTLEPRDLTLSLKFMWFNEMTYVSSIALVKVSILCFYLRVFADKRFRQCVMLLIGLNLVYMVTFVTMVLFQCEPRDYYWHKWDGEHEGKCLDFDPMLYSSAILNILLDFAVLGLPLRQLWNLKLNLRSKLLVFFMFAVGFLVTLISIVRLRYLAMYSDKVQNFTWVFVVPGLWTKAEVYLSVVCACMPAIGHLIRRVWVRTDQNLTYTMDSTMQTTTGRATYWQSIRSNFSQRSARTAPNLVSKNDDTKNFVTLQELHSDGRR